jgi:hypothetical protein
MSMQYDVKSAHASVAGSLYGSRVRLKGFVVTPAASTASTITFKDGSATGATLCEIDIPSNTNPIPFYVAIPQEGILFQDGIYMALSAALTGVTIFYG